MQGRVSLSSDDRQNVVQHRLTALVNAYCRFSETNSLDELQRHGQRCSDLQTVAPFARWDSERLYRRAVQCAARRAVARCNKTSDYNMMPHFRLLRCGHSIHSTRIKPRDMLPSATACLLLQS